MPQARPDSAESGSAEEKGPRNGSSAELTGVSALLSLSIGVEAQAAAFRRGRVRDLKCCHGQPGFVSRQRRFKVSESAQGVQVLDLDPEAAADFGIECGAAEGTAQPTRRGQHKVPPDLRGIHLAQFADDGRQRLAHSGRSRLGLS